MIFETVQLQQLNKLLQEENNFLLLSHVLPDGDSVGSTLAFAEMLRSMNKQYKILFRDPVPEVFSFLVGNHQVYNLSTYDGDIPPNFIMLDCSEFERLGEEMQFLSKHAKNIVNIDHHISNNKFGDIAIVKDDAAATCELLHYLFTALGLPKNTFIAKALYTGMVTDTGGFRYESTSSETLAAASELLKLGVDLGEIRQYLYENVSLASILILQKALANLKFSDDGQLAWLFVTNDDMSSLQATGEHCEGIVNYPLAITGVKMTFFFREMPEGIIKVGLRARRNYNVNKLAALFGGGGHAQAAGCTIPGPLDEAIDKVITAAVANLKGEC